MNEFDLQEIYASLASYKGLPFPFSIHKTPGHLKNQLQSKLNLLKGENGQVIICPVTLKNELTGKNYLLGGKDSINIQPAVQVEGSLEIERTTIEGSEFDGTVKENLGFSDYMIRIFGVVINKENQKQYPYDQVKILKELWKLKGLPLGFDSEVHRGLFSHIVLYKFRLDPIIGRPGIQAYEFKAYSDNPNIVEQLSGE